MPQYDSKTIQIAMLDVSIFMYKNNILHKNQITLISYNFFKNLLKLSVKIPIRDIRVAMQTSK